MRSLPEQGLGTALDGLLVVDKPAGWTSHDVVAKVRRLLGVRKVGHTGTLDPAATGVLVLCLGKATRISEYLVMSDKAYRGTLRLGISTETQDGMGAVVHRYDGTLPSEEMVRAVIAGFVGVSRQVPPMYSAVKVKGVPLYKAARAGRTLDRASRECVIHELNVLSVSAGPAQDGTATIDVIFDLRCSKGTYVRTLCADIGETLGTGGHLARLERRAVGQFRIEQALSLAEFEELVAQGTLDTQLHPLSEALTDLPVFTLDRVSADRACHGTSIPPRQIVKTEGKWEKGAAIRLHAPDGQLLGIGKAPWGSQEPDWDRSPMALKVEKVLV
jgi:tRNA pseudouridine55 synthase